MHNKVILTGRFTHDPELRQTQTGVLVCNFSLAVQRKFNRHTAETATDFINVETWNGAADFVSKYFHKGDLVDIEGDLRSSHWDDSDGKPHTRIYVRATSVDFAPINGRKEFLRERPTSEEAQYWEQ